MINDDYNDFVSLSTKLVNVDGALARMQGPLLELQACVGGRRGQVRCPGCLSGLHARARPAALVCLTRVPRARTAPPSCLQDKLEAARGGIAGQAAELASGLQRRQAVAAARALLELMQVRAARACVDGWVFVSGVGWGVAPSWAYRCGGSRAASTPAVLPAMPALQDTAHVMSKVDKLLGEVRAAGGAGAGAWQGGRDGGWEGGREACCLGRCTTVPAPPPAPLAAAGDGSSPEELEAHCRLLDRVASEVSRLQFYAARGQVRPAWGTGGGARAWRAQGCAQGTAAALQRWPDRAGPRLFTRCNPSPTHPPTAHPLHHAGARVHASAAAAHRRRGGAAAGRAGRRAGGDAAQPEPRRAVRVPARLCSDCAASGGGGMRLGDRGRQPGTLYSWQHGQPSACSHACSPRLPMPSPRTSPTCAAGRRGGSAGHPGGARGAAGHVGAEGAGTTVGPCCGHAAGRGAGRSQPGPAGAVPPVPGAHAVAARLVPAL